MPVRENPIETLSSEVVFECPWYSIRQDKLRLPDGTAGEYNVVQRAHTVFVVAMPHPESIMMVYTYRYPIQRWSWEVIAGSAEEGHTPLETAQKELREETGAEAKHWQHICEFAAQTGVSDEYSSLYLARDIVLGEPEHESTEIMQVHTLPLPNVLAMIDNGELIDALSIMAILRTLRYLERNP